MLGDLRATDLNGDERILSDRVKAKSQIDRWYERQTERLGLTVNPPCRTTFLALKENDPHFRAQLEDADAQIRDAVLAEVKRRALEGHTNLVYQKRHPRSGQERRRVGQCVAWISRLCSGL